MQKIRILLVVIFTIGFLACEGEGPAYSETASGEAPVVDAELEEDTGLADDAPLGEPAVMDVSEHEEPVPRPGMRSAPYGEVPPASHAIQETPSLPGGHSGDGSLEGPGATSAPEVEDSPAPH